MGPIPRLERVSDLVLLAGALPPRTVVIPGGDREDDLRLVESARDHGIVERCLLVGDGQSIRRAAAAVGIRVPDEDIVATADQEETARRTIELVRDGTAEVILKGNISTPILNRAILGIRRRDTMSLVTLFDAAPIAGGRPLLLTDPGVTTVCDPRRMTGLIRNAIDLAHGVHHGALAVAAGHSLDLERVLHGGPFVEGCGGKCGPARGRRRHHEA